MFSVSSREGQTPSDDSRLTSSSSLSGTAREIKFQHWLLTFSRGSAVDGAVSSAGGFPVFEQFQLAHGTFKSAGDSRHSSSFSWRRGQSSQQGIPGIRAVSVGAGSSPVSRGVGAEYIQDISAGDSGWAHTYTREKFLSSPTPLTNTHTVLNDKRERTHLAHPKPPSSN